MVNQLWEDIGKTFEHLGTVTRRDADKPHLIREKTKRDFANLLDFREQLLLNRYREPLAPEWRWEPLLKLWSTVQAKVAAPASELRAYIKKLQDDSQIAKDTYNRVMCPHEDADQSDAVEKDDKNSDPQTVPDATKDVKTGTE